MVLAGVPGDEDEDVEALEEAEAAVVLSLSRSSLDAAFLKAAISGPLLNSPGEAAENLSSGDSGTASAIVEPVLPAFADLADFEAVFALVAGCFGPPAAAVAAAFALVAACVGLADAASLAPFLVFTIDPRDDEWGVWAPS